jgi:MFS transporter, DHA1 family, multidrug resistance protein
MLYTGRPESALNKKNITAYFIASFLYWAAQYIFVPTFPAFVKSRVDTLAAVGIVLSMYGLWSAILRIPTGVGVSVTGRAKAALVGGFLLAAAGTAIMGSGRTVGALTLGRALTGASTATWVPVMVVFAGFFPVEKAVFATSLLAMSTSLGQVISTASTGFLNSLGGYPLAFYAAAGLAVVSAIIVAAVRVPRTGGTLSGSVSGRSILKIFTRADVLLPSFASAITQFGVWAIVFSFLPLLARQVGAREMVVSLMMTANLVATTAANLLATLAVGRGRQRPFLLGSFFLLAAGAVLAAVSHTVGLLFAATCLMGLANGFFYPVLLGYSIQKVDLHHRTTAMGIHQAIYALGMFAGPWIGGIVADALGIRIMFGMTAGFCSITASILVFAHGGRARKRKAEAGAA